MKESRSEAMKRKRGLILIEIIRNKEGLTLFDLAERLNCEPHAISGRITELKRQKLIMADGRRLNRKGNTCSIYFACI